jgi:hypothetical protein
LAKFEDGKDRGKERTYARRNTGYNLVWWPSGVPHYTQQTAYIVAIITWESRKLVSVTFLTKCDFAGIRWKPSLVQFLWNHENNNHNTCTYNVITKFPIFNYLWTVIVPAANV